ncbi:MAG: two-component regulator propeller domain-containing protein, partial [Bacteroidota bacterium]
MNLILRWIFGVWMICLALMGSGQENISFRKLSKKDGLSQASVFAIVQDSVGFMWFGTRDGLNRFDGYQFKTFKKNDSANSIVANDIRTLYIDPLTHDLWIGTIIGLSRYDMAKDSFSNFLFYADDNTTVPSDLIRQIFRDTKGRLWVGTSYGLHLFDEENHQFNRFFFDQEARSDSGNIDVKAIIEDREGVIWFGTVDGLYYLSEEDQNTYAFKKAKPTITRQLSDVHIKSMLEDQKGNLWIGTFEGGLNYWDRKKDEVTIFQNEKNNAYSLSHNNVRSMSLDEQDNLWVGTFDGLNFLEKNKRSFKRFTKSEFGGAGLSDKSIRSVFIDRRGSLWLGTYYGGINYLDENNNRFINFKNAPLGNALSGDVVSSFVEDENGHLWIGTEGDGLNFYHKKTKAFYNYRFQPNDDNSLSGNNVKELLLDGERLWIGTFQAGLNLLNIRTKQFQIFKSDPKNSNSLANNNVYDLHKEGQLLWILTYGGGVDILDLEKKQFHNFTTIVGDKESLSSEQTRVILKTRDGQFWIGTENGLNKVYLNTEGLPNRFERFLANRKIFSLQEDASGIVWVGTFTNGLFRLDTKKNVFEHFTTQEGLPGNTIFGILEAEEGEIWLSTNNGLSKFNPQEKTFTNYNYSNGLENSEYNFNAYYKTRAGDLLFGGINGFTQFNPKDIQANEFIPPVVFTELRKNNQIIRVGDETKLLRRNINQTESIVFNYREANFSIRFAGLDYVSPENNHYAFMLAGIDKDWNYSVGKTEATYTIQREGEYIFRMKGGNSDGVWNPKERQLKIIVLPPPWRTWWAYFIYLGIAAAFVFALIRFIRLRHSLELEQIAKQQQQELHEVKMRFFTNITHEFRTPLTLILGPLNDLITAGKHSEKVSQQLSSIQLNAQRLLNLVNQVLTFRKLATDHEPLKIVHGDIVAFLQEIFLPFQDLASNRAIAYHFETTSSEITAWFDQDKLEKVFFNLLSNAFKFTPDGGKISMLLSESKQYLEIRVRDNGSGIAPADREQIFKRFYEKSDATKSNIKGTGIGLAISKQMVELHQGKIFVEDHHDLTFENGASFVVQLPKGNTHFDQAILVEEKIKTEVWHKRPPVLIPKQEGKALLLSEQKNWVADAPLLLIVEDNPEIPS